MPPTVSELTNIKNFRGNILDRQFPVQFNPDTGMYSYNYANITPNVASKLRNLKFYRKASRDLKEIEADLAAYLKKEGPAPPPVKGEITKAAEAQVEKSKKAEEMYKDIALKEAREGLTAEEETLKTKLKAEAQVVLRSKKAEYAKQQQEKFKNAYNTAVAQGIEVPLNTEGRIGLLPNDKTRYNQYEKIITSFNSLQKFEEKEKRGEKLSTVEQAKKRLNERTINTFLLPPRLIPTPNNTTKINEKGDYNAARAVLTKLGTRTNLSLEEEAEKAKAKNVVTKYIAKNPKALAAQIEKEASMNKAMRRKQYKTAKQKLNNLNKKPKPLSPTNTTEQARLQAELNTYRGMDPNINEPNTIANLQMEGVTNLFEEPTVKLNERGIPLPVAPVKRELTNEAFQSRRAKAQVILDYLASVPLTPEFEELQTKAQKILNSFATIDRANASAKNKKAANKTIRNSNFLNRASTLKVPTNYPNNAPNSPRVGGGGKRTRKQRKSRRRQ